jgi:tetratricopeptide (TPR) repeat protein
LIEEAVLANAAGKPTRAEQRLTRATALLGAVGDHAGRRLLRARIDVTLALALFARGRRDQAFATLDEADALLEDLPPTPVHSLATAQRASLFGRSGDWHRARELLESIDLSRPEVSPRTRTLVDVNLGLALQFLSRYSESDARLSRAHQRALAHRFDDLAAAAIHNRGRLQMLLGNLPRALALMAQAQDVGGHVLPPAALLDSARVLAEAGLVDRALDALGHGAAAARRGHITHDLAETDLERARLALLRGEPTAARRLAIHAQRRFQAIGEPAWATRAILVRIESDLTTGRRRAAVADEAVSLVGHADRSAVGAEAAVLAAEACARAGRTAEARRLLEDPPARRGRSFPVRLQRLLATAELHRAHGEIPTARRTLRRGAMLLASEQARYTSLDSRTAAALHARRLRDALIEMALASGSPREVFAATELWRGVSHRLPPVTSAADPEIASLTADARRLHAQARDEADPARRSRLETEAGRAEQAIAQRDLQAPAPERAAREHPERPVAMNALRPLLSTTGTGVLSLFLHRQRLRAVVVTSHRTELHELADADTLTDLAVRLRADVTALQYTGGAPLAAAIRRSMRRDAARLGAMLEAVLPQTERLVILPSRGLASVPWRMIPGIADRPITVAPSATFWARRRIGPARDDREPAIRAEQPASVVALAGPGPRRAADEVRAVSRAWGGQGRWLAGPAATGPALAEALRDERVVHVAAHGVHHDENPLFSAVNMADGPQWIHEVQRVGVGASHVVLSSCDVGRTHMREGDEGLGLTAGLLACGVRSVVAAVAPVGDATASELMPAYHRALARGVDAAQALEESSAGIENAGLFCVYGADWAAAPTP